MSNDRLGRYTKAAFTMLSSVSYDQDSDSVQLSYRDGTTRTIAASDLERPEGHGDWSRATVSLDSLDVLLPFPSRTLTEEGKWIRIAGTELRLAVDKDYALYLKETMPSDQVILGRELRKARLAAGKSPEEIAICLNKSAEFVLHVEQGLPTLTGGDVCRYIEAVEA